MVMNHAQNYTDTHTADGVHHWLTLQQAAARARVHEATLRREIQRGRLRHARVGGRKALRLRPEWIDAWLEQTSTPIEVRS
jgi:excisionase family DNA binding protein